MRTGMSLSLGIALGVVFGVVFDNIALGIAFGVVFGVIGEGMIRSRGADTPPDAITPNDATDRSGPNEPDAGEE